MQAVIFIGIQASGKTSFYRERFFETHVRISMDLLRTRHRERAFIETCLRTQQRFVIDNTNLRVEDRAVYIALAHQARFQVIGYYFDTELRAAIARNSEREGKRSIPVPGIVGAFKRLQIPIPSEGFDELNWVKLDRDAGFSVGPWPLPEQKRAALETVKDPGGPGAMTSGRKKRIFLLSPAHAGGERAALVFSDRAQFPLAVRLRNQGVPLGELFAFISGLYFRGKLAYAQKFAAPPRGIPGSYVITAGRGLIPPETEVNIDDLRAIAAVPIDHRDLRYSEPLTRDAMILDELVGPSCEIVLLGSVATTKYLTPLLKIFGERLLFPLEFVGRGDMSRGGLMLRCARVGVELNYVSALRTVRHGPRPPKLPKLPRA